MSDPTPTPATPLNGRMEELATGLNNLAVQYARHGSTNDAALSRALESINDAVRCGEYDVNHRDPLQAALRCNLSWNKGQEAEQMYHHQAQEH